MPSASAIVGGVLSVLLATSLLGNWFLVKSRDAALKDKATAISEKEAAIRDGNQCTARVEELRKSAEEQRKAGQIALAAAQVSAQEFRRRADATLSARPTKPDDLCASALELSRERIKGQQ